MASDSKKEVYEQDRTRSRGSSKVLGLGLVSAASAIAGGFAVAWWYRKTLTKLQNPIVSDDIQRSKLPDSGREIVPYHIED